jgi:hypothetical protein
MFGVPGDFNLGFLVGIRPLCILLFLHLNTSGSRRRSPDYQLGGKLVRSSSYDLASVLTQWSSNELNAAYAADGYARVKEHSIGVVLTTCVIYLYMRGKLTYIHVDLGLESESCLLQMESPEASIYISNELKFYRPKF